MHQVPSVHGDRCMITDQPALRIGKDKAPKTFRVTDLIPIESEK